MSSVSRRDFFRFLAAGAAVVASGELLLPTRTIFLPPAAGWPTGEIYLVNAAYLNDLIRRACIPKLVTQIYQTNPLLHEVLRKVEGASGQAPDTLIYRGVPLVFDKATWA